MIAFPVSEKKAKALQNKMVAVGCHEKDLDEKLLKGAAISILHRPTGITVRCNRERSQALNRFLARRILVEELEARIQNKTRHEVKAERLRQKKGRNKRAGVNQGMSQFQLRPMDAPTVPPSVETLLEQWRRSSDQGGGTPDQDDPK